MHRRDPRGHKLVTGGAVTDLARLEDTWAKARQLHHDLERLANRDPEQEVLGLARTMLDAVVAVCVEVLEDDPVVQSLGSGMTVDELLEGTPLRAADALVVVGQLDSALHRVIDRRRPRVAPRVINPDTYRRR
jgi:hypothetical protein